MKKKNLLSIGIVFGLSACANLHSVSLTQVPADRSHPIEASATSWGILELYGSNEFVTEAVDGLREKCPEGRITGVYTKYDGRSYFLWGTRTVTAKAFCEARKS